MPIDSKEEKESKRVYRINHYYDKLGHVFKQTMPDAVLGSESMIALCKEVQQLRKENNNLKKVYGEANATL
jgi:hypothetical protein